MQVKIPKAVAEAFAKTLKAKPFNEDLSELRWHDHIEINLTAFTTEVLLGLAGKLGTRPDIRGVKTLVRNINAWATASQDKAGAAKTKARSLQQMESLLIEYVRYSPRKHVYELQQAGEEGVALCYFVDNIDYESPRNEQAAHIDIGLAYEEFGVQRHTTKHLWSSDVIGKTAPQVLQSLSLLIETPPLRADYTEFLEEFGKYRDAIGRQCLAIGVADDEGIDGNDSRDLGWWRSSRSSNVILDANGEPARVVVDVYREEEKEDNYRKQRINTYFWHSHRKYRKGEDGEEEYDIEDDDDETSKEVEIPIHPHVPVFDLKLHKRLRVHVGNLKPYIYDTAIRERLVLPERNAKLIDTLLVEKESKFRDIVAGKSGGVIILCQGKPGTGKTLTAEVYAEALQRPLYTVQCSQLGTDPNELEDNLMKVLARGRRWGAVMLLDEADVYVHQRGNNLAQNAIVGVFLRVLEYHSGVLFLTTNRGDLVDDAILSRCTARVPYDVPDPADQARIWAVLAAANDIDLPPASIAEIVAEHNRLSGRDIKNLLKLSAMVAHGNGHARAIDAELVAECKIFKPTVDD